MSEIVEGATAVKFFGWEIPYLDKLATARENECTSIRKYRMLQVTSVSLGRASPILSSCLTIIVFSLLGKELEPGIIFATISVFQSLRFPLILFPSALTSIENIR